jgi:uncharacterized protein (DUF2267 family)
MVAEKDAGDYVRRMNRRAILEEIRARTGLRDTAAAERALAATWSALATCVAPEQRSQLVAHLPADLHARLSETVYVPRQRADQIYDRVAAIAHVPTSRATELAQVALRACLAELDATARELIASDLPDELAELLRETKTFTRPAVERSFPALDSNDDSTTLASGRPGSSHPISEVTSVDARHVSLANYEGSVSDDDT